MLAELIYMVGAATSACLHQLTRRERRSAREWLDALERMVRNLLLIEVRALGLPPLGSPARSPASPSAQAPRAPAPRPPAFILVPESARTRPHPARIRRLGPPFLVSDLWRDAAHARLIAALRSAPRPAPHAHLVNRIAALARVIAEPLPAIRRLARLLRARLALASAIAIARGKIPYTFHGDANHAANIRALNAALALNTS